MTGISGRVRTPSPTLSAMEWTTSRDEPIPRSGPRHFVTLLLALAALVLFPALRHQLDYTRSYYRSTREIVVEYPRLDSQARQFTSASSAIPLLRRPRLDRSTFFHKGASEEEIQKYFHWDPTSIDDPNNVAVQPMWTCRDPASRSTKLVFNHMPGTGGVTIRALLKGYSMFCNASLAIVSQCTFLGRETMDGVIHWANGYHTKHALRACGLTTAMNRSGHLVTTEQRLSTSFLNEHNFDILAGHFPLGSDEFWKDPATGRHVSVQNLVFFRKPLDKFVSQILSEYPQLVGPTIDETVALILAAVQNRTAHGEFYELYSRTLIRPEQRSWVELERIPWTSEQRLNLTLRNMVESNMVIGLLERLEPTIELIRHLLDKERQVPDLAFSYFASDKLAKRIALFHANGNRTKVIVERIEQDPVALAVANEYLKYDRAAYEWAVRIHERQVQAMQESYPHSQWNASVVAEK